jgi:hypothetical protein
MLTAVRDSVQGVPAIVEEVFSRGLRASIPSRRDGHGACPEPSYRLQDRRKPVLVVKKGKQPFAGALVLVKEALKQFCYAWGPRIPQEELVQLRRCCIRVTIKKLVKIGTDGASSRHNAFSRDHEIFPSDLPGRDLHPLV